MYPKFGSTDRLITNYPIPNTDDANNATKIEVAIRKIY